MSTARDELRNYAIHQHGLGVHTATEIADKAAELFAAVEGAMVGWQPIETAPKDCGKVLVVHRGGEVKVAYNGGFNGWRTIPGAWQIEPTHWMPLPKPPTRAAAEQFISAHTDQLTGETK